VSWCQETTRNNRSRLTKTGSSKVLQASNIVNIEHHGKVPKLKIRLDDLQHLKKDAILEVTYTPSISEIMRKSLGDFAKALENQS
jgi:hypothetical protein